MVLHNRLWFYIMDYVKSIISEIIPGLWTLWTNYEHYEVPEPLMFGVHEVLVGFLHRGPRTRACTNSTCARAAPAPAPASSFGRQRRWARGQTAGRRRRWDWSWKRRARPRRGEESKDASSETQYFLGFRATDDHWHPSCQQGKRWLQYTTPAPPQCKRLH